MNFRTQLIFAVMLLPVTALAQNFSQDASDANQPRKSILNRGWSAEVDRGVRPVADPATGEVVDMGVGMADYWRGEEVEEVTVILFKNGSSEFEKGYGNAQAFTTFDHILYDVNTLNNIEYITVTGAASPEGTSLANEQLAVKRALTIKNYLIERYPYIDPSRILVYSAGEDWRGLRDMIRDDPNTPGREDALRLLNSLLPGSVLHDRLQEIAGGTTYEYVLEHMFPALRGGVACTIVFRE
jgi:outer membrane protein OmpA-like peptidoglycan-associated protein